MGLHNLFNSFTVCFKPVMHITTFDLRQSSFEFIFFDISNLSLKSVFISMIERYEISVLCLLFMVSALIVYSEHVLNLALSLNQD